MGIKDVVLTLVSFVLTECKPLIVYVLSVQTFTTLIPTWFFEHVSLDIETEMQMRKLHGDDGIYLGEFLECVRTSFKNMVSTPTSTLSDTCLASDDPADLHGLGIQLGTQPLKVIGYYSYVGLAIASAMCILLMVKYIQFRPGNFGGGKFIQFTLHLRSLILYKVFAVALAAFAFMLVVSCAFIGYRVYVMRGFAMFKGYAQQFAAQVIGLTYSGVSYVMPDTKIEDKFKSSDFGAMTFKRPLKDISIDSLAFCKEVSHAALYAAATGTRTDIDKYTGGEYTSADTIIEFVKRPSDHGAQEYMQLKS